MQIFMTKDEFKKRYASGKLIKKNKLYCFLNEDRTKLYVKDMSDADEKYATHLVIEQGPMILLKGIKCTPEEINFLNGVILEAAPNIMSKNELEERYAPGKLVKRCNQYCFLNANRTKLYVQGMNGADEIYSTYVVKDDGSTIFLEKTDNNPLEITLFKKIISEEMQKSFEAIRKSSRALAILAQGNKGSDHPFYNLTQDALVKIASFTGNLDLHSEKDDEKVAGEIFCSPKL